MRSIVWFPRAPPRAATFAGAAFGGNPLPCEGTASSTAPSATWPSSSGRGWRGAGSASASAGPEGFASGAPAGGERVVGVVAQAQYSQGERLEHRPARDRAPVNVDLDNDIDRLYGAPREDFVRERDVLVRALRKSGDREVAAEVAALRKPTLVAWTVNQLAHTERRDVDLLLDAGKRIIDAQQSSIAKGGRADLDAAQASLRRAIGGLTAQAGAILGPDASKTTLTRVAETLRTAATAPAGRELLARGRLSDELSGTGWEIVAGFTPAPRAHATRAKKARKKAETPDDTAARRAEEIQSQTRRLRELKKSLAVAETNRRNASREERAAEERLEKLRAARADADAEVESIGEQIAAVERALAGLRADRG